MFGQTPIIARRRILRCFSGSRYLADGTRGRHQLVAHIFGYAPDTWPGPAGGSGQPWPCAATIASGDGIPRHHCVPRLARGSGHMGFAWAPDDDGQPEAADQPGRYAEGRHYYRGGDRVRPAGRRTASSHRAASPRRQPGGRHASDSGQRPGLAGLGFARLSLLTRARAGRQDDSQPPGDLPAPPPDQPARTETRRGAHAADRSGSARQPGRRRLR